MMLAECRCSKAFAKTKQMQKRQKLKNTGKTL